MCLLQILQEHLQSFCDNLEDNCVTDVQTADHVSVLMKDSFVGSFHIRDREFMKDFVETQMFSVYTDTSLK